MEGSLFKVRVFFPARASIQSHCLKLVLFHGYSQTYFGALRPLASSGSSLVVCSYFQQKKFEDFLNFPQMQRGKVRLITSCDGQTDYHMRSVLPECNYPERAPNREIPYSMCISCCFKRTLFPEEMIRRTVERIQCRGSGIPVPNVSIPDPGSKRFWIPDPDPHQTI